MGTSFLRRLLALRQANTHYWGARITHEMEMAYVLTRKTPEAEAHKGLLDDALCALEAAACADGTITREAARAREAELAVLGPLLKRYTILCAAHAHIDMNWMWGFAETVSVTLDTFRTMLWLMDEYPDFTFSQSQASVYEIVEKHDPVMLAEIKRRVKEGRWEVTATNWVEPDKNMPNGESLTRHILYTKRYLSRLLDIDPDGMTIDFVPDTFGHNLNVPEALANGGVKYMYHCRGYVAGKLYRYQSPSGASVLVYCEPYWYNSEIGYGVLMDGLQAALSHGTHTSLKVYGVGDHGGGPTRRDVERLIDFADWPLAPSVQFGTFKAFFEAMEIEAHDIPVETKELNFIFDGCYTTQSRIKAANRIGELRLTQAETLSAYAAACFGQLYPNLLFEQAWRKVLFNHFHDILPGSGVQSTREHALGTFSETLAAANTAIGQAVQAIVSRIDVSAMHDTSCDDACIDNTPIEGAAFMEGGLIGTNAEGAGAGFNTTDFALPASERSHGRARIFHVFNTTAYERTEPTLLTLWDWPYDPARLCVTDSEGRTVPHQFINSEEVSNAHATHHFWGHQYRQLLVDAACPAVGYNTYRLTETAQEDSAFSYAMDARTDTPFDPVLENEQVRVVFNPSDLSVISFYDKGTKKEYIDKTTGGAGLRYRAEDATRGMTAWVVGRYMSDEPAFERVILRGTQRGALTQRIQFTGYTHQSKVDGIIALDYHTNRLEYTLTVDWFEKGTEERVPQLAFAAPLAFPCEAFDCDIANGVIERKPMDMDVPAPSFAMAKEAGNSGNALMLVSRTKYGFRCFENRLSIDLLRSARDPDPYPEIGIHRIEFAMQPVCANKKGEAIKQSQAYNAPLFTVSNPGRMGGLTNGNASIPGADCIVAPLSGGFLRDVHGCVVASVKQAEDSSDVIVRFYEAEGCKTEAGFTFAKPVTRAEWVDGNERTVASQNVINACDRVSFTLGAYQTGALRIAF